MWFVKVILPVCNLSFHSLKIHFFSPVEETFNFVEVQCLEFFLMDRALGVLSKNSLPILRL